MAFSRSTPLEQTHALEQSSDTLIKQAMLQESAAATQGVDGCSQIQLEPTADVEQSGNVSKPDTVDNPQQFSASLTGEPAEASEPATAARR